MSAVKDDFYQNSDQFTSNEGFQVAAALIEYKEDQSTNIEDPEIGTLKMYLKSWGVHGNNSTIAFQEVNTTFCGKDKLNDEEGSNSKSKFYQTKPSH